MKYGIRGGIGAVVLACLLFWSGCGEVRAFVDPPVLVPEHPQALQPVHVRLRWGVCDAFAAINSENVLVESTGTNSIRIRVKSWHYDGGPGCIFGPGTSSDYPIGSFPSGTYQVEVQRIYEDFFGDDITETLGVLELRVAPTNTPATVPTLQDSALWTMALLVALTAAGVRRRRLD